MEAVAVVAEIEVGDAAVRRADVGAAPRGDVDAAVEVLLGAIGVIGSNGNVVQPNPWVIGPVCGQREMSVAAAGGERRGFLRLQLGDLRVQLCRLRRLVQELLVVRLQRHQLLRAPVA